MPGSVQPDDEYTFLLLGIWILYLAKTFLLLESPTDRAFLIYDTLHTQDFILQRNLFQTAIFKPWECKYHYHQTLLRNVFMPADLQAGANAYVAPTNAAQEKNHIDIHSCNLSLSMQVGQRIIWFQLYRIAVCTWKVASACCYVRGNCW